MNFVSSSTAASTPPRTTSEGPFPSNSLRRHQVFHWLQYTFCVLPPPKPALRSPPVCPPRYYSLLLQHMLLLGGVCDVFMILHFVSLTTSSMYSVGKSGCRIVSKNLQQLLPILVSLHSPCTSVCRLRAIFSFDHLEIMSATTSCTPGICFASWLQPPVISSLPSSLMARAARLLRDAAHRLIDETAATLSPLNLAFLACFAKRLVSRALSSCHNVLAG